MTRMTRRLTAACAALTLAAVPLVAQERGNANATGIKVHGHWTIDVRKADGTLVSHHEFENALTSTGGLGLAQLLARAYTAGGWGILLDGGVCQGQLIGGVCIIQEPSAPAGGGQDSSDLSVSVPAAGQANAGLLVLKGSVTAQLAGQITTVRTRQSSCLPNASQTLGELTVSQCAAIAYMGIIQGNPHIFDVTAHTITPSPIAVDAGQFIQVTVVISFTSAS
jgi:hypothetical protein